MTRTAIEIGHELLSQGRYREARPILERAVSEYPREGRAHLYLAIALAQLGETALAEKHFANAIALSPRDAYVFYNWGAYLHHQGRLQDALNAYETAYRLDPTMVGALQMAQALRSALGQPPPSPPTTPTHSMPPTSPPSTYTPQSPPPPATPDDLSMPPPGRFYGARRWVSLGLLLAIMTLCLAPVGLTSIGLIGAILCGIIAIARGSLAGGIAVIVVAIVMGLLGVIVQLFFSSLSGSPIPS